MMNVFDIKNLPKTTQPVFAYSHIIYFHAYKKLQKGWNIVIYGTKALITKGYRIFKDIKHFKHLSELYDYLHRFGFDEQESHNVIYNKKSHIENIKHAVFQNAFISQFNLNAKFPLLDIAHTAALVFIGFATLFTQTSQNLCCKHNFFEMVNYLEQQPSNSVKKITNKPRVLNVNFYVDTPDEIMKGVPHYVNTTKN